MDETNSLTDSVIAAAFAASPLPDTAIDDFLNRYRLCIEALKKRRAAENTATTVLPAVRSKKTSRKRGGSAMAA